MTVENYPALSDLKPSLRPASGTAAIAQRSCLSKIHDILSHIFTSLELRNQVHQFSVYQIC